ncbi:MAG: hypothetical protein VX416_16230 [Pseudomonadota bacterium]|nr:hypothetical protein [Pseudomonadota bacterium]
MSFETVEEAIVYVFKKQKSYIEAEADAARAKGDTETLHRNHKRIEDMGFGVKVEDLTDDHEEARVDELFVWIERYEQKNIKHTPVNQKAYELLKNDKDLFLV